MHEPPPDAQSPQMPGHGSGCVLIVGAGRFARNYVRALTGLSQGPDRRSGAIQTLILTRTHRASADALAAEIRQTWGLSHLKLVAARVRDSDQLQGLLQDQRPQLTCITARDPDSGDRIHATYSLLALDYGAVLCEKPFSVARDAAASQVFVHRLRHHPQAGRFGLELPMAVVKRALLADPHWGAVLRTAREIDFMWQMRPASHDLVSDLALHPWSLIPAAGQVQVRRSNISPRQIVAWLQWPCLADGHTLGRGRMILACGGDFRGMRIDEHVLQFQYAQDKMRVLEHRASWEEATRAKRAESSARIVLEVDNPLKQHIAAALQAQPIVDYRQTIQSQLFAQKLYA